MGVFRTTIESGGRIQIPSKMLEELEFAVGQVVEIEVEKKSFRVSLSVAERVKRAQERVRKYVPEGVSLVDELIADRRREAEND